MRSTATTVRSRLRTNRATIRRARQRVLVIGAGRVAQIGYIPAIASLGWEVLVLDLDAQRAESVARLYRRASWSARPLEEVDASRYDVVVVATPPRSHAALTLKAIHAGARSILVEKPPFLTMAELDTALETAQANGARIVTCFIRRAWPAVVEARRRFSEWSATLGALERVAIAEGRPWDWASVATVERGTTGLESMLENELPHPLDAAFHIASWRDVDVRATDDPPKATPWSLDASVEVEPRAHPALTLALRGSRSRILANAVTFSFEGGDVVVETSGVTPTSGGIIVRTPSGSELVNGPPVPLPVAEQFATPLRALVDHRSPPEVAAVDEWREPLKVVSLVEARLGSSVATGSDAR